MILKRELGESDQAFQVRVQEAIGTKDPEAIVLTATLFGKCLDSLAVMVEAMLNYGVWSKAWVQEWHWAVCDCPAVLRRNLTRLRREVLALQESLRAKEAMVAEIADKLRGYE